MPSKVNPYKRYRARGLVPLNLWVTRNEYDFAQWLKEHGKFVSMSDAVRSSLREQMGKHGWKPKESEEPRPAAAVAAKGK
ncbi:MAG: hypothetical protein KGJ23_07725 [Euryarchaeota archaeon]|nr:hypothetical protein [Euryarchaeota archaeon]MDE1836488.1 hypothetical protein [Euryarchaeota archaeon]MDE1880247.1 hypothetical protein [Euryarchaeota archaeon]MDE2044694.1 hypothetical protein [Thermoplasmata archaeon]